MLTASTRSWRSASSETAKPTSTSLISFVGSTPFCFRSMLNGPWVPPPITDMPTVLPLRSANSFDWRILFHCPVDRKTARLFEHVLRHDVGLQIAADHAIRQRQRRLGCAIE